MINAMDKKEAIVKTNLKDKQINRGGCWYSATSIYLIKRIIPGKTPLLLCG